jgi:hypothetical protein
MSERRTAGRAAPAGLGLGLAAAGAYGLLRGAGVFGHRVASEPLLLDSWRRFVTDNAAWLWPAAAVAALLLAVLAVLPGLRAELVPDRTGMVDLTRHSDRGLTEVRAVGAAKALANDVETYRGVLSASARLRGAPSAPAVDLRVDVADDCDLPSLRRHIDEHALARFRQALELGDGLAVRARFRLREPARSGQRGRG